MHVDEIEALRNREIDGLPRVVREVLEHRVRAANERVVIACGRNLEDRVADAVALRHGVALDEALAVERCEQAPRGTPVETAARRELGDGQRLAAPRDRLQERSRAVDGLDRAEPGLGVDEIAHCPPILPTSRASRPSAPPGVTSSGLTSSSAIQGA
jgi:hypothetical protein